jgi:hypothetical protein
MLINTSMKIPLQKINRIRSELEKHPLLSGEFFKDITDLHIFMEHHVFAVWDFMSLLKCLQNHICPSTNCWYPTKNNRSHAARLINQIVLAEESDLDYDGLGSITHHDLYCQAMLEIGADARPIEKWVESVADIGVHSAMDECAIPDASLKFIKKTFSFIDTGEPHIVAAAFCFGRETVIPKMFKSLTASLDLNQLDCPKFHYYLERHIEIDGEEHGPASIQLVENLCDHDPVKIHEAEKTAIEAIRSRIQLWDDILSVIQHNKENFKHN